MFPKPVWPTVIGKETFICCGICHENCAAFLWILAYRNVFYAPFYIRPQFTSYYELWVWACGCVRSHVPRDVHRFVCKAIHSSQCGIFTSQQGSTEKFTHILFTPLTNSEPDRPYVRTCTVHHTVVSYIKLSRDLFLGLTEWEQLLHRYLQRCCRPVHASSTPLQKHPVPEISF